MTDKGGVTHSIKPRVEFNVFAGDEAPAQTLQPASALPPFGLRFVHQDPVERLPAEEQIGGHGHDKNALQCGRP